MRLTPPAQPVSAVKQGSLFKSGRRPAKRRTQEAAEVVDTTDKRAAHEDATGQQTAVQKSGFDLLLAAAASRR